MGVGEELRCQRHGNTTRIRCVTCDTPICPDCAIRTPVGWKCPDHASRPPPSRRSRASLIAVPLAVLAVVGLLQVARTTGRGEPAVPPCPTETAPDVGIGREGGGGHWTELSASDLCGRYDAAAVWTGDELVIWGGENCAGADCPSDRAPRLADGGAYRPAGDKWRKLPRSPLSARAQAAAVWTGTEMLTWGGRTGNDVAADGAGYVPGRDRWRILAAGPLAPRAGAAAVWTGREMVVWGGAGTDHRALADGAAYDPAADRWRTIAPSPLAPRELAVAAWTGREMLLWGGVDASPGREAGGLRDGAAYDPAADRWRTIAASPLGTREDSAAVWTGRELLIWGGAAQGGLELLRDGAAYDPAADRWRRLPDAPFIARAAAGAVWSGREMLVWGGIGPPGASDVGPLDRVIERRTLLTPMDDGAAYDPATDRWRVLEPVPLLGRGFPTAVWDGQGMLVWGGLVAVSSPASAADGVRYTP